MEVTGVVAYIYIFITITNCRQTYFVICMLPSKFVEVQSCLVYVMSDGETEEPVRLGLAFFNHRFRFSTTR